MEELETIIRETNSLISKVTSEKYPVPSGYEGVKISVDEDTKLERVIVSVGDYRVSLSILGARDLALSLRKVANRAEKRKFENSRNF